MKQIPLGGYYHFKSCVACTFHPGIDRSLLYLYDALGVKYINADDQSTCSGFCYYTGTMPWSVNLTLSARSLSLVEESNSVCVCVCPTSYGNLRECNEHFLKNPESMEKTNSVLKMVKRKYNGNTKIYHASEVIHAHREKLRKMATYTLDNLKVATHHGCHYTRIFYDDIAAGECEKPVLLDGIVETFGGKTVIYSEQTLCCGMGFYHTLENREYTKAISLRKLRSIRDSNPDMILVQCPGCLFTLDYYQGMLEKITGEKFCVPVISYAELTALLIGADPLTIAGVRAHRISLDPVLKKIGLKIK